jgi:hypothetical protein
LHGQILALARHWRATFVVVDATGVGAGLAGFLEQALGERRPAGASLLIPLQFTPKLKSDLGWGFVGIVETGRYHDYADDGETDTAQFWYEVAHTQYEVRSGPAQAMRWGVWEAPGYDGRIACGHDDLLFSAALCSVLDRQEWPGTGQSGVVEIPDALEEIDAGEW